MKYPLIRLALFATFGCILAAAALYASPPSRADEVTDSNFAAVLADGGVTFPDVQSAALAGKSVCGLFEVGRMSFREAVQTLIDNTPIDDPGTAGWVIGASTVAYCPEYKDINEARVAASAGRPVLR